MSRFHTLKVVDVNRETADAVSVAFDVPANIKQEFTYKQGQYLTLKFTINGEELRRSYSICSSPLDENELRVAIKKVKEGRVSGFINDNLKVGDVVEVMNPMGNFYSEMNPSNKKNYILFGGGSGITPLFSILKTVLKSEPNSRITLFYGNNDELSVIFNKQIELLALANADRLNVVHVLNTPPVGHPELLKGMMTKEKNIELVKNYVDLNADNVYFICGPGPMMESVVAALKELKINESQIHVEYFSCRALLQEGKVQMAVNYALSASEVKQGFILTCQSRPTTSSVVVNYDKGL
ncbi:MAG: ferredoxin--NADP reductase [Bacteroidetes bacterium]|nr:ferredoxin--NADP reductase [Bacteroidota bacterium]